MEKIEREENVGVNKKIVQKMDVVAGFSPILTSELSVHRKIFYYLNTLSLPRIRGTRHMSIVALQFVFSVSI